MSGRGRGVSNQPAWMTRANNNGPAPNVPDGLPSFDRRRDSDRAPDDYGRHRPPPPRGDYHRGPPPPDYHRHHDNHHRGPPRRGDWDRQPRGRGDWHRQGQQRRRINHNNHSIVKFNSYEEERAWVEERRRKRQARESKWDKAPTPDQAAMDARSAAMTNFAATDFSGVASNTNHLPQQTRHARRLYIGNLPEFCDETGIQNFFRTSIETALGRSLEEHPILSVYINHERRFCFIEFKSVEMTTACMALDGVNVMGRGKVKIKRPNDYNPAMAPTPNSVPLLDVTKLGIISPSVPDGPHKIFVGGLHYHLTEEQVVDLLGAFGKVKAFHLVKQEPDATTSKGYCFVEYADHSNTQMAVVGLNGMDLGQGKVLSARIANSQDNAMAGPVVAATQQQSQQAANLNGRYNVEELVDAAMGLRPMPTAPSLLGMPVIPLTPLNSAPSALPNLPPPPPPATGTQSHAEQTTRILVLLNMVTDDDLASAEEHQELVGEVREECAKFGSLLSIKIPRPQDPGIELTAVKKVFLEYASTHDALRAKGDLGGRKFGDSVVETSFFSEEKYAAGKLA